MAESWFEGGAAPSGETSFFANDPAMPPPVPRGDAAYELRPLTTGEILDRTFFLYRNNFWLFAGLAAIAAGISVLSSLGQLLYLHFAKAGAVVSPFTPGRVVITVVSSILYLVVYSVTQAATVSGVTAIYLGDTTSTKTALKAVMGKWYRYLAIALWQAWSGIWMFVVLVFPAAAAFGFLQRKSGGAGATGLMAALGILMFVGVLGGMVYGVIAYIRNSLAVPAEVMEGLTIRAAIKRSKMLAAGTKGRIFLLFLFLTALYVVAIAVESPLTFLIIKNKGVGVVLYQAMLVFVNFVIASVIAPVGAIGLCLFYIDQRVRKEGFDIEFLMERAGAVDPVVQGETVYPAELS